jgi:hypothetical protein
VDHRCAARGLLVRCRVPVDRTSSGLISQPRALPAEWPTLFHTWVWNIHQQLLYMQAASFFTAVHFPTKNTRTKLTKLNKHQGRKSNVLGFTATLRTQSNVLAFALEERKSNTTNLGRPSLCLSVELHFVVLFKVVIKHPQQHAVTIVGKTRCWA